MAGGYTPPPPPNQAPNPHGVPMAAPPPPSAAPPPPTPSSNMPPPGNSVVSRIAPLPTAPPGGQIEGGDPTKTMKGPGSPAAVAQQNMSPFEKWLQDYYTQASKGVDFEDPRVKALLGASQNAAMGNAKKRGIGGPMSIGAGQQAWTNSAAGLYGQSQQQALQALGMGLQNQQANNSLGLQRDYFGLAKSQAQYGMDQDAYQRQLDQSNYNYKQAQDQSSNGLFQNIADTVPSLFGYTPFHDMAQANYSKEHPWTPPQYTGQTRV